MRLKQFFSRKKKEETTEEEHSPWSRTRRKGQSKDNPASLMNYIKGIFASFGFGMNKRLGSLTFQHKIQIRLLRQFNRGLSAVLFLLYVSMALLSLPNLLMFMLFLGTAYLMLGYLWKTRRIAWEKPKDETQRPNIH